MIEAVLIFGVMNVAFEFILLCMVQPRTRLRMLGSSRACTAMHVSFLVVNLIIHWGTVIGTMSAVFAFICSMATVTGAKVLFGTVVDDRFYHVGVLKYAPDELR